MGSGELSGLWLQRPVRDAELALAEAGTKPAGVITGVDGVRGCAERFSVVGAAAMMSLVAGYRSTGGAKGGLILAGRASFRARPAARWRSRAIRARSLISGCNGCGIRGPNQHHKSQPACTCSGLPCAAEVLPEPQTAKVQRHHAGAHRALRYGNRSD